MNKQRAIRITTGHRMNRDQVEQMNTYVCSRYARKIGAYTSTVRFSFMAHAWSDWRAEVKRITQVRG